MEAVGTYLAVFERRHGTSVDIQVGVYLDGRGSKSHHLTQHSYARRGHPLAYAAQNAPCVSVKIQYTYCASL